MLWGRQLRLDDGHGDGGGHQHGRCRGAHGDSIGGRQPTPRESQFTFGGQATGAVATGAIACDTPTADGSLIITVFGSPPGGGLTTLITVQAGKVSVRIDAGESTSYTERDFSGTGVTGFDGAKGAQLDGVVTEVSSPFKKGTLPAISSIKGSVDCGNQRPGTSTLTLAGSVTEGAISGPLDPVRVECDLNAKPPYVHVVGVSKIGTTPVLVILTVSGTGFTAFFVPTATSAQHLFMTTPPTTPSLTPTGAKMGGTAREGSSANSLQVIGELVCGTMVP